MVYVDNAIFIGRNKNLVDKKKALFMAKWECQDLGDLKEFLQMHVTQQGSEIKIDQTNYLKKVLEQFKMVNAKSAVTPLIRVPGNDQEYM